MSLGDNDIGDQGTVYLAEGLEHNQVRFDQPGFFFFHIDFQTLISLSLWSNEIHDQGSRHLARALERNTVLD